MRMRWTVLVASVWLGMGAGRAAEPGVSTQKIVLGMSTPLTGPLGAYGTELGRGLKLGLAQVNAAGGIAGREIELQAKDDAGRPEQAVANTRALLDAGVVALTGYHGAASIEAAMPLVEQASVPWIGIASSAELLREPPRRGVFNLRAGAREEAAAMVLQLDTIGLTEIAVVVQDDALGRAALDGVRLELTRLALRPHAVVQIASDAGPPAIAQAVQSACKQRPQALALGLDARNALAVIRAARKTGCSTQFYVMSEAGAQLLAGAAALGELAGLIVSQVVPHPTNASSALAADYRRIATQAKVTPSYAGMEGFLYARVIAEALRRCGRGPTRRCVTGALEGRPVDAGGYLVQFSPTGRRGSRFVEMTIVTPDGRFRR